MAKLLEGRSTLITGGGSGIGRAAAFAFAREGASVAVLDISHEAAQETAEAILQAGGRSIALACNVVDTAQVKSAVDRTIDSFGGLDCAFNNAGIGSGQVGMKGLKLAEWSDDAFNRIIDVNLRGVWNCMKHELLAMEAQGSGVIVNTSSIAGVAGVPGTSAYAASKHAVVGLTKTAAIEYALLGIRINAICPGSIKTPMSAARGKLTGENPDPTRIPMGRKGEPEDIAEMAVFLSSDRASFITGSAISVDGGTAA
jgi:NAD(P)-dependent dehydrogenase (short-subunit alcohol dehydrogenase family)